MNEQNEKRRQLRAPQWAPAVSIYERFAKWGVDNFGPCDTCSPVYIESYARLAGLVDAAEACYRDAYHEYAKLSRMAAAENHGAGR